MTNTSRSAPAPATLLPAPADRHAGLPSRRACLIAVAAGPLALPGPAQAATDGSALAFARLDDARSTLERLAQGPRRPPGPGSWNWPQTLQHLAQSIEFSMQGFPQSKPAWFQRTLGSAAFGFFRWRGRMTHGLTEPIPGAPDLDATLADSAALARLTQAMARFQPWNGPLVPHFAYGDLDKTRYDQAHAMHLAEHLSLFLPQG